MIRKLSVLLVISFFQITNTYCQTCTIKTKSNLGSLLKSLDSLELKRYNSVVLNINGKTMKATDPSSITVPVNKSGFDTITYSFTNYKNEIVNEVAICKFHSGETYLISPCSCCGIFLIAPEKEGKRGFVKFVNRSSQDYLGQVSEFEYDSIPQKSDTEFIFADISQNCGFKPSNVYIIKKEYLSPKYQYTYWKYLSDENKIKLQKEQEKLIIYKKSFLFLHEERLIVTIDKNSEHITIELKN